jgi:DNA-binding HxlR family transcriptional regulator
MDERQQLANCTGIEEVVRMIGGKWKIMILRKLIFGGTKRFNELRREVDGITQTMLTSQLRALEEDGLVKREIFAEVPPRVEYSATLKAMDLEAFFRAMYAWGVRNVASADDAGQNSKRQKHSED